MANATREELIKQCRYYKGENTGYDDFLLNWFSLMERVYCETLIETPDMDFSYNFEGSYYDRYIGKEKYKNHVPYGLCVVMYTAYAKHFDCADADTFDRLIKSYETGDLSFCSDLYSN